MKRELRLSGISLTKHGKRRKKVLELEENEGLIGITTKGNKQFLLIGRDKYWVKRVVIYNTLTDEIETDFESEIEDRYHDCLKLVFSPNGSFVLEHGTYFKYNPTTKTYSVISLPLSEVIFTKWLSNSFITVSSDGITEFSLEGNEIRSIELPEERAYFEIGISEDEDKLYLVFSASDKVYEFDINNFTFREIQLPESVFVNFNGTPIQKLKNTNYLLFFGYFSGHLYKINLETNEYEIIKDFSYFPSSSRYFWYNGFNNDGKIFIFTVHNYTGEVYELWFYNIETDELRRISLFTFPLLVLEDPKNNRIFLVKDCSYGYSTYVYDYNNDKILGAIGNNVLNPIHTDGEISLTL